MQLFGLQPGYALLTVLIAVISYRTMRLVVRSGDLFEAEVGYLCLFLSLGMFPFMLASLWGQLFLLAILVTLPLGAYFDSKAHQNSFFTSIGNLMFACGLGVVLVLFAALIDLLPTEFNSFPAWEVVWLPFAIFGAPLASHIWHDLHQLFIGGNENELLRPPPRNKGA